MLRRLGERLRIHEVSIPVREKGLWWEGFVEKVVFEPDVKERGSYVVRLLNAIHSLCRKYKTTD